MERKEHPSFIEGRCASIVSVAGNDEIGHFGELHPRTITNFHLEHPIIAFEFDVEKMMQ
jgi:phenylalanyl-tRNA synthetase beta chain